MALPINDLASGSEIGTTKFRTRARIQGFSIQSSGSGQASIRTIGHLPACLRPSPAARTRRWQTICEGQRARLRVSDGRSPKRLRSSTEKRPI